MIVAKNENRPGAQVALNSQGRAVGSRAAHPGGPTEYSGASFDVAHSAGGNGRRDGF
jgi:hypothetical protein